METKEKKLPRQSSAESHIEAGSEKPRPDNDDTLSQVLSILAILAFAILLAVIIKAFLVQPYIVDGNSMETTLQNRDRLIVNKVPRTLSRIDGHAYVPKRGEIVIFNKSNLPGFIGTKQLIKRVIGLPGDHVVVKNSVITIYNKANPNGFNPDTSGSYRITSPITPGDIDLKLSSDQIFVCGDNRLYSEDSRDFGPIKIDQIVGKLAFRILPLNKAQHFSTINSLGLKLSNNSF